MLHGFLVWFFFFWPHFEAYGILVLRPGIEPVPPATEAQGPSPWTARGVSAPVALTTSWSTEFGDLILCDVDYH